MEYGSWDLSDAAWRTSSHSSGHGGKCVEIAPLDAAWRKSSHSDGHGGNCVETAPLGAHVGVRDSKNPDGPALVVTAEAWRPFLARTCSART